MKNQITPNYSPRKTLAFIETGALLCLSAVGFLGWNINKKAESAQATANQAVEIGRQNSNDIEYLGNSYADYIDSIRTTPQPKETANWRKRITPIGSVEYIRTN